MTATVTCGDLSSRFGKIIETGGRSRAEALAATINFPLLPLCWNCQRWIAWNCCTAPVESVAIVGAIGTETGGVGVLEMRPVIKR